MAVLTTLRFRLVDWPADREVVRRLTTDYMRWVAQGIDELMPAAEPIDLSPALADDALDPTHGERPPEGAFYVVEQQGAVAGMCALRRSSPGVAEFKRIYVCPSHRGLRIGDAMLRQLIRDAVAFGYEKAVLDSAPFMQAAHCLYAAAGFTDRAPYAGSEVPPQLQAVWRFMERRL
jgi:ribosomal protein S18 acetylase RimI-like enzyme